MTSLKQSFSKEDLEEFLALYSLVESQPKRALKRALLFRQKHPDHPAVLNLLSYLYLVRKNILKGNHLIRENYAKNPDNIFAKINYADLCIRKKRYDEVPKVFNQKFNLPSLYP
ncbi:MAG: hypothetical protein KDK60_03480, partial [Chlamydiia bacterium]|nr:hypothetical protein [Chlamydiia bacterium]